MTFSEGESGAVQYSPPRGIVAYDIVKVPSGPTMSVYSAAVASGGLRKGWWRPVGISDITGPQAEAGLVMIDSIVASGRAAGPGADAGVGEASGNSASIEESGASPGASIVDGGGGEESAGSGASKVGVASVIGAIMGPVIRRRLDGSIRAESCCAR